jgi:hypothetical protein
MNAFTKQWITTTCAPDSIGTIRSNGSASIECVWNEDKSKSIYVLCNRDEVVSIGRDYNGLRAGSRMSVGEACERVAQLLGLSLLTI